MYLFWAIKNWIVKEAHMEHTNCEKRTFMPKSTNVNMYIFRNSFNYILYFMHIIHTYSLLHFLSLSAHIQRSNSYSYYFIALKIKIWWILTKIIFRSQYLIRNCCIDISRLTYHLFCMINNYVKQKPRTAKPAG